MAITLDKVIEEIKSLTRRERHRLREVLDGIPDETETEPSQTQQRQKKLDQRLIDKGIISHIPPLITDSTSYQNRKLIVVQGQPLSETIIERTISA